MKDFFVQHSLTELLLCLVVGAVAVIAACQQEWATAGALATGAFAIMKGRSTDSQQKGATDETISNPNQPS